MTDLDVRDALRMLNDDEAAVADVAGIVRRGERRRARRRAVRASIAAVPLVLVIGFAVNTGNDGESSRSEVVAGQGGPEQPAADSPPTEGSASRDGEFTSQPPSAGDGSEGGPDHPSDQSPATEHSQPGPAAGVAPPSAEGSSEDRGPLVEDAEGDTGSDPWAVPGATRQPEPSLDLRAGDIHQAGSDLTFTIRVTDLEDGPPPGADGSSYRFGFDYADDQRTTRLLGVAMDRVQGVEDILLMTDNGSWECGECSVSFDTANEMVVGVVPVSTLEEFVAQFGAEPGGELRNLNLASQWVHVTEGLSGERLSMSGSIADNARSDRTYAVPRT